MLSEHIGELVLSEHIDELELNGHIGELVLSEHIGLVGEQHSGLGLHMRQSCNHH